MENCSNKCMERIATLEEWKGTTNGLLSELRSDVKSLNRSMWVATGVILTIQILLKFSNPVVAYFSN